MFPILWALLLLPVTLGNIVKVDITRDTPGTRWSPGWTSEVGAQYFGGTLMSVKGIGGTLTYRFTGASISVYGIEGTKSRNKRESSSFILDGTAPRFHKESMTTVTPNVLFYNSTALEDTQHTLVIQNLVNNGELQLDYFALTGSTVQDGEETPTPPPPSSAPNPNPANEPLRPAVIVGLAVGSVVVLAGFVLLFVFWRRHSTRKRTEVWEMYPKLKSQDDAQKVPFLNERAHIEPFTSMSSQHSRAPTPTITIITPSRSLASLTRAIATPTSHRNEKRFPPASPGPVLESISRLNLGLDVGPNDHSVVGQPSDYESEAGASPHHQTRSDDGGISLLGSSETINPKALRLPPDYRRFYP